MDAETKKWIDKATYEELLAKWRFAGCREPMFIGVDGEYFFKTMYAKRAKLKDDGAAASAKIGFVNPKLAETPPAKKTRTKK